MDELIDDIRGLNYRHGLWAIVAILAIIITAVVLWLVFGQDSVRDLMPQLPSPTARATIAENEPVTVTFSELNENPVAYRDQSILVTGAYLPMAPQDCQRYSGPAIRWSLTAESLQLDAVGYERIVQLLPAGSMMTVEGFWRLYQGPLGCGKGPPEGSAWFLEVKKIVQPNPLVGERGQVIPIDIENTDSGLPPLLATEQAPQATPTEFLTATATFDATILISPTSTQLLFPTQTPSTPSTITLTPNWTQTPTPTTPATTPDPGSTAAVTATATDDPSSSTPTLTAESPPNTPTSTQSPGNGYPGPSTPSVTPTSSPESYPGS
jgi:hypothetical protein